MASRENNKKAYGAPVGMGFQIPPGYVMLSNGTLVPEGMLSVQVPEEEEEDDPSRPRIEKNRNVRTRNDDCPEDLEDEGYFPDPQPMKGRKTKRIEPDEYAEEDDEDVHVQMYHPKRSGRAPTRVEYVRYDDEPEYVPEASVRRSAKATRSTAEGYDYEEDLPPVKGRMVAKPREPNPDYLKDELGDLDYSSSETVRRGKGGRSFYLKFAKEYLEAIKKVRSPLTIEALARRYKRQYSDMEHLYKSHKLSTLSPQSMTVEDIRSFIQYRWDTGVSQSEMMHEIASMKSLFGFMGSNVFQEFLYRYPQMKAQKTRAMLPSIEEDDVQRIIAFANNVPESDWKRLRAYALVAFAICSGLRSKEMRLCNADDITRTPDGYWIVKVRHPKGEATYGKVRNVIMNSDCIPVMERYLQAREEYLCEKKNPTKALFVGSTYFDGYLRSNTLRQMKEIVVRETGVQFDLRTCRRTFGQRLVDKGVDIESVSKVMGHVNPVITSEVYCSKKEDAAIASIKAAYGRA